MAWTTERIDRLKELAARNWSFSQIADALNCSRNAVAGQLFRLKINIERKDYSWDKSKSALLEKLHIAAYPIAEIAARLETTVGAVRGKLDRMKEVREKKQKARANRIASKPWRRTVVRLDVPARPIMVPFMELGREQCRYIPGEVNGKHTIYCGAPVETGQPYCSPHCRTCFQPRA
jgi:GcrA cell cycle regulator